MSRARSASSRAPGVEAEDRAQDDLERQRLQARVQRDRLVARPARDLALGDLGHRARSRRSMRSPWKAGSMSLRCSQVRALVEQDHRVAADDRLEDARPLARVQHVGRRGEDLLDLAPGRRS